MEKESFEMVTQNVVPFRFFFLRHGGSIATSVRPSSRPRWATRSAANENPREFQCAH
jgi:hypothetical protein